MSFYSFAAKVLRRLFSVTFNVEIDGIENIPCDRTFIVAPNHLSNFDPPVLGVFMPMQMTYMAKDTLFKVPLLGGIIRALGAFPVKKGKSDIAAVRTAIKILRENKCLVIFPEGRRSRTPGVLGEGKQGAVLIALKAKVGILPVGIDADYKFRGRVKINIGKYIDLSEYYDEKISGAELQQITDNVLMPAISELSGAKLYGN